MGGVFGKFARSSAPQRLVHQRPEMVPLRILPPKSLGRLLIEITVSLDKVLLIFAFLGISVRASRFNMYAKQRRENCYYFFYFEKELLKVISLPSTICIMER